MPIQPSLAERLFKPLHSLLDRIMPEFAEEVLDDPKVRQRLARRLELALLNQYPAARALPEDLRRKIIGRFVELALGKAAPDRRGRAGEQALAIDDLGLSDEELAMVEASAPGNSVRGFLMDAEAADDAAVQMAVEEVLGQGWTVVRLDPDLLTYEASHPHAVLSVAEGWTLSHRLEETSAIARAEPEILGVPAPVEIGGSAPATRDVLRGLPGSKKHLPCSDGRPRWHLEMIHADLAWEYTKKQSRPEGGAGVLIGQLDTGVTHHAEVRLDSGRILVSEGKNFYDPDHPKVGNQPLDPMDSDAGDAAQLRFATFDGHGTGTASMITGTGKLRGVAPAAQLIPFRVAPTVVHFDVARMAEAMKAAHQAGCDVITMSMGAPKPKTTYLEEIIKRAADDGVIICTAAGNYIGSNNVTPMVVWPAAYDPVIAVAGCNCNYQVWSGSSRGPAVNITAPAEDVWNADPEKGSLAPDGSTPDKISRGSGTSFATPTVAGMAACWLAHHGGRKELAKHYGHARYVPLAFAHLLRTAAHFTPSNWMPNLMGPGILDASELMRAPLPAKSALTGWPRKSNPFYTQAISSIAGWVGGGTRTAGRAPQPSETALGELDGELGYLLFDRPALLDAFAKDVDITRRSGSVADPAGLDDAAILLSAGASDQLASLLRRRAPVACAISPAAVPPPTPGNEAEWTILVYMAGDNNLDGFGHDDLEEMKRGLGSCQTINVLVQRDSATPGVASARYRISDSPDVNADVIQNLGETNTGDPATLQEFLEWGLANYPAKRTMAVLWNHGSGWDDTDIYQEASRRGYVEPTVSRRGRGTPALPAGFVQRRIVHRRKRGSFFLTAWEFKANGGGPRRAIAFDDDAQDFLDNVELRKVFHDVVAKTGRKFDVIGMDACLMSMVETAVQLNGCAEVFCGSQEVEPAQGWPYEAVLGALVANPQIDGKALAELIVNEFIASYPPGKNVTQSAWSGAKVTALEQAVNSLGQAVKDAKVAGNGDIYRALSIVRDEVQTYENQDYIDLGHFCALLEREMPALADAILPVKEALDDSILANKAPDPAVARSSGLSIYFPTGKPSPLYRKLEFGNGAWAGLVMKS